ncbi:MAG: TlyA family RNA methyltransferase [Clostridia bacterium]|nr:TlyA family RNA methyltransferase [Clostridia bacterium]
MEEKVRLDCFLKENGYFESREKAKNAIENNLIKLNGTICNNPSKKICLTEKQDVEILGEPNKYVSRGALKLEKALAYFNIDVKNKIATDIGSSTGGFSDVLLQNDIKKIYCIDVGKNQLHSKIRNSPKTVVYEETDFRNINFSQIDGTEIVVIDVSFISIKLIIKKLKELFENKKVEIISLIKPQFECGKEVAKKYKGVIKSKTLHKKIIADILNFWKENGFEAVNLTVSPIKGGDGNIEYLLHTKNFINSNSDINIEKIVNSAFEN